MDLAINKAKEKEKSRVWLGVWENNTKAIKFYKRNGFHKIGTHHFVLGNEKQVDWLMALNVKR